MVGGRPYINMRINLRLMSLGLTGAGAGATSMLQCVRCLFPLKPASFAMWFYRPILKGSLVLVAPLVFLQLASINIDAPIALDVQAAR